MMTEQPIESAAQNGEQYWQRQIERWETSNLTQAEFCRRNGFKSSKFLYWKTKLRKSQKSDISFVQIPVGDTNTAKQYGSNIFPIRIVIHDRFQIEIGPAFDPGTLQRLIHTLERL